MQTVLSLVVIITLLFILAAAKVLLRTNLIMGLSIIGGGCVVLAVCWFIYKKYYAE